MAPSVQSVADCKGVSSRLRRGRPGRQGDAGLRSTRPTARSFQSLSCASADTSCLPIPPMESIILSVDIHSGIIATALMLILFAIISVRNGVRGFQAARKMTFYRLRRQREALSWRLVAAALVLLGLGIWLPFCGEPIAYQYFPPSPTPAPTATITIVPTITVSPTITLSPTITDTPLVTDTPTITPTPFLPSAIVILFQSLVTPNPGTVYSPLLFTTNNGNYPARNPATVFQNPVGHMYAVFSYDQMAIGAQWSALWYYENQLVHFETRAWNCAGCSTGGPGFTDWSPPPDQWKAGEYHVIIFVGEQWKVIG